VPSHIIASMQNLNTLSTFGAHPKEFDPEQVRPVLINLTTIIKWYLKYKDKQIINKSEAEEVINETKVPENSTEQIQKPKKRMILLPSGLALVVVVIIGALFLFDVIGGGKPTKELEKSIAVLPFKLLSDEPDKQYLADGMMDAILLHLSKIEDLHVMSRTSTEQYRESGKTMPEIGRELGVEYLLEGSFQKSGDHVRLIVQLIQANKDDHVWSNEYDRKWNDIFSVQSEVEKAIAGELHAVITPEEKQLIEKKPTTSLTAYDFYQRGREQYIKYWINRESKATLGYWIDNENKITLEQAEDLYHKALTYDSTFAQAYTGLASIYWDKHFYEEYFSEDFLDSVLVLCDIALSYDNQIAEAYIIRGYYYDNEGLVNKALDEYDKALNFNPNAWEAYYKKGELYAYDDFVKAIENREKAASLNHGSELSSILTSISIAFQRAGFKDQCEYYANEALLLDGGSSQYYYILANHELCWGNFEKSLELGLKANDLDSNNLHNLAEDIAFNYMLLGKYDESLKYYIKYFEMSKAQGVLSLALMHRIGYAYWKNGYPEEANYYFDKQIEYCNNIIELGRKFRHMSFAYYDLAGVYAFRSKKEEAYENLRILNQIKIAPLWLVTYINNDPLFNSIRDEPEFQQIVRNVEAKYRAEHERVRKWLEENDLPG
jgi:TolB-like protein